MGSIVVPDFCLFFPSYGAHAQLAKTYTVDNIFVTWTGTMEQLISFYVWSNDNFPELKFTISSICERQILNQIVYSRENRLCTNLYMKPTD